MPGKKPLTIKINGTDRTDNVDLDTIVIEDVITNQVNSASFVVLDAGSFGIAELQEVIIEDADTPSTRYFAGYIQEYTDKSRGPFLDYTLKLVDYSWDLSHAEALVNATYTSQTDAAILQAFMATTNPSIDVTTNVTAVDTIDSIEFDNVQPATALNDLQKKTGADWYIDYNKKLHWFSSAAAAPYTFTDNPTLGTHQTYGNLQRTVRAPEATKVEMIGAGTTAETITGTAVGGRHIVSKAVDRDLTTTQDATDFGNQLLTDLGASPSFTLIAWEPGIRSGQSVTLVNAARSINDSYVIQRVTTKWLGGEGHIEMQVELGMYRPTLGDIIGEVSKAVSGSSKAGARTGHEGGVAPGNHTHTGGADGPKIGTGGIDVNVVETVTDDGDTDTIFGAISIHGLRGITTDITTTGEDGNINIQLPLAAGDNFTLRSQSNDWVPSSELVNTGSRVGIGLTGGTPNETLEVDGGILIGTAEGTNNGTIQWTGTDFQGRVGGAWVSLTGTGLPSGTNTYTLRYNGSAWVNDGTIRNDGTNVSIGGVAVDAETLLLVDGDLDQTVVYGALVRPEATGTSATVHGVYSAPEINLAGTVTAASSLYAASPTVTLGTVTTAFGLYIENIVAGATNYGIYSPGTVQHYLNGNLGIGTASPSVDLHVDGDIRVTGIFYDSSGDAGTSNQVLTSTATGTNWVSTKLLPGTASTHSTLRWNGSDWVESTYLTNTDASIVAGGATPAAHGAIILKDTADNQDVFLTTNSAGDSWINVGNLGIGTNTPSHHFHVLGDTWLEGALYDTLGAAGASGELLQSTGTGTDWVTVGGILGSHLITRETPTGAVNGSNVTYTLANTPISGTEQVYLNGVQQDEGAGNDYTISGATITMAAAPQASPGSADTIRVTYWY